MGVIRSKFSAEQSWTGAGVSKGKLKETTCIFDYILTSGCFPSTIRLAGLDYSCIYTALSVQDSYRGRFEKLNLHFCKVDSRRRRSI